jgi:hypothetical protein
MLVELCNNYVISNGLVNKTYGLFKPTMLFNNKSYIWIILFHTIVGITIRFPNLHLCEKFDINLTCTLIKSVAKNIRIRKKQTHLITLVQFPIQPIATKNHSLISRIIIK